jgi:hypothetical protein
MSLRKFIPQGALQNFATAKWLFLQILRAKAPRPTP